MINFSSIGSKLKSSISFLVKIQLRDDAQRSADEIPWPSTADTSLVISGPPGCGTSSMMEWFGQEIIGRLSIHDEHTSLEGPVSKPQARQGVWQKLREKPETNLKHETKFSHTVLTLQAASDDDRRRAQASISKIKNNLTWILYRIQCTTQK